MNNTFATTASWLTYFLIFGSMIFAGGEHTIHIASQIIILGLFALSFNVLFGSAGLLSFGQAIFYGLGAYITGMMAKSFGAEYFLWALLLAPVAAMFLSVLLGTLSLRLSDVYFTMLTLAFAQLAWGVTVKWSGFTGGDDGIQAIPKPDLLAGGHNYYIFSFTVVTLCVYLLWRLDRSPFGAVLKGIRQNPVRISFIGMNVFRHKLLAYVISSCFTAIAGGLYAGIDKSIHPDMFVWTMSGSIILMTILGGMRSFFGPLIGVAVFVLLEDVIGRSTQYWSFVIGVIMIIVVLLFPKGIVGISRHFAGLFAKKGGQLDNP
ncbi:MAG: branched-chain amino acid ABC transporter permease [Desulfuromonadales bacterium]